MVAATQGNFFAWLASTKAQRAPTLLMNSSLYFSFSSRLALHLSASPSQLSARLLWFNNSLTFLPHQPIIQLTHCRFCSRRPLLIWFIFVSSRPLLTQNLSSIFLRQMVYWLCNPFTHVSVNLSEVLCACWGGIQHFLSQETQTVPLCGRGDGKCSLHANRVCCCCYSMKLWALQFVHSFDGS